MIQAAVISNGLEGLHRYYVSNNLVQYTVLEIDQYFNPNLDVFDLLIVPNGSDHIAMAKMKDTVSQFLNDGKALFCFDGWFTNWVPGNQWIMSNDKKTIDIRYRVHTDTYKLFDGIDINKLIYSHNISGWWACGYIEASKNAEVVLEDTWKRPIIVLDEKTTNGIMILTASGPLGDSGAIPSDEASSYTTLSNLYQNMLHLIIKKKNNENHRITF
jgi:hypothetical protein